MVFVPVHPSLTRIMQNPMRQRWSWTASVGTERTTIRGITVIGDVLRPDGKGAPGGVDRPSIWLFDAIKRQVHLACGLPIDVVTTASPGFRGWLDTLRSPASAHRQWALAHECLEVSAIPDALLQRLRDRFCIGYELPPWLRLLLRSLDVPYVDLRLHPVRFLDDLLFAARASRADTQADLLAMAEPESLVIATAGLREAMCHMVSEATVPAGTLIVLGQRQLDSSQIVAGAFFDCLARAPEIRAICECYAAVLLKPHPLEPEHALLEVAADARNVIGVTRENLYRLMSLPEITGILTVNSSAASEAAYFGKRTHTLAPLPFRVAWRGAADGDGLYASLNDRVLTVDFWRTVLAPVTRVTEPDDVVLPPKPNRLRIALDSFWNFQEIDTDRVPGRPAA
jgi:hypothetical protein